MARSEYAYNIKVLKSGPSVEWMAVFRNIISNEVSVISNDAAELKRFMEQPGTVFMGYDNRKQDQYLCKAIVSGLTGDRLRSVSDFLDEGNQGYRHPELRNNRWRYLETDLHDDIDDSTSLLKIAGHMGYPLTVHNELTADGSYDYAAIRSDLERNTLVMRSLFNIRLNYIQTKQHIGSLANIGVDGIRYTNAGLCAIYLQAKKQDFNDARNYKYPEYLLRDYVPQEIFNFFNRIYDPNLTEKTMFATKCSVVIGGCSLTVGDGGLHGAIPHYDSRKIPQGRIIKGKDVMSFFPSVMLQNGYVSRTVADPNMYRNVVDTRLKAKAEGNKKLADPLKTVVNVTYGAMRSPYNALYDPLMGRSIIITGQLLMIELLSHIQKEVPDMKVVQANTDGFCLECNASDSAKIDSICTEWQTRTGLTLEDENLKHIIQKTVNDYIAIKSDDSIDVRGQVLARGIKQTSSFRANNNAVIVADAVREYILNGTPIEDTISNCNKPFMFQYVTSCKRNCMYEGEIVGKVNRVYASSDRTRGTLTLDNGNKVSDVPDHVIVDNDNQISIGQIDKAFYIEKARSEIESFLGINLQLSRSTLLASNVPTMDFDILSLTEEPAPEPIVAPESSVTSLMSGLSSGMISQKDYDRELSSIVKEYQSKLIDNPELQGRFVDRCFFVKTIPEWLSDKDNSYIDGSNCPIVDREGNPIAPSFDKVIVSPIGVYLELDADKCQPGNPLVINSHDAALISESSDGKAYVSVHDVYSQDMYSLLNPIVEQNPFDRTEPNVLNTGSSQNPFDRNESDLSDDLPIEILPDRNAVLDKFGFDFEQNIILKKDNDLFRLKVICPEDPSESPYFCSMRIRNEDFKELVGSRQAAIDFYNHVGKTIIPCNDPRFDTAVTKMIGLTSQGAITVKDDKVIHSMQDIAARTILSQQNDERVGEFNGVL